MGSISSFSSLYSDPEDDTNNKKIISVVDTAENQNIKTQSNIDDGIDKQIIGNDINIKSHFNKTDNNAKSIDNNDTQNELINIINDANEYYKHKKYDQSIIYYTKAIKINNKDHSLFFKRSNCYRRLNKYKEAYNDIHKCVELKPKWLKGYIGAGYILFKLEKYNDAKRVYQHGLQLDPNNEICSIGIKDCDMELKKQQNTNVTLMKENITKQLSQLYPLHYIQRALDIYEKTSKSLTNYDTNQIIIIIFQLQEEDNIKINADKAKLTAKKYYSINEWNKAINEYTIAIKGYNTEHTLYYNRGQCYLKINKYKESLNDGNKCIQLKSTWIKGYCLVGKSLLNLNKIDEAQKVYQQALNLDNNNIECLECKMKCDQLIQERKTKKLENELNELKKKKLELEQKTQDQAKQIDTLNEFKEKEQIKQQKNIINCSYYDTASKILNEIFVHIPIESFDENGNKCYCLNCHNKRNDEIIYKRGYPPKRYGLPIGWVRFGIKTDTGFCGMHNVWDNWHAAYHGTTKDTVPKIFKHRLTLLKPGDIAIGGNKLDIRNGHIKKPFDRYNNYTKQYELFDPNQIYLSPSIKYASNEVYARTEECKHPLDNNKTIKVQFVFQVRIRPGSYGVGQQTVGATSKLDQYFSNDELEWYTKENMGIVLHGLLIRFY